MFSRAPPYISNTFSRESQKFQTGFHVNKRSPHHSKDLLGSWIDLEIQILYKSDLLRERSLMPPSPPDVEIFFIYVLQWHICFHCFDVWLEDESFRHHSCHHHLQTSICVSYMYFSDIYVFDACISVTHMCFIYVFQWHMCVSYMYFSDMYVFH